MTFRCMCISRKLTTQDWALLCFRHSRMGCINTRRALRVLEEWGRGFIQLISSPTWCLWARAGQGHLCTKDWWDLDFFAFNSYSLPVSPSQISLAMTVILLHFNLMKHFSLCKKKASGGEFRIGWEEGIMLGVRGCGSGKPRSLLPETGMGLLLAPHFSSLPASQR